MRSGQINSRRSTKSRRNDRLRAMRFALYARQVPAEELTVRNIAGLLGVCDTTAAGYRRDLFTALSPIEVEGIPPTTSPREPTR